MGRGSVSSCVAARDKVQIGDGSSSSLGGSVVAKTEAKGSDVTRERECFCNLDDMIGWLDFERRVVAVVDSK
jgi:hypothetical protein